jgi:hypothetical protein
MCMSSMLFTFIDLKNSITCSLPKINHLMTVNVCGFIASIWEGENTFTSGVTVPFIGIHAAIIMFVNDITCRCLCAILHPHYGVIINEYVRTGICSISSTVYPPKPPLYLRLRLRYFTDREPVGKPCKSLSCWILVNG